MILKISQLTKYFKDQCVLDEVDLEISEPTIMALVAPNGTGKSTFLNIITNIESASYQEITILDKKHTDSSIFKEVTYLQDNSVLYGELTGQDHLDFVASIHEISKEAQQALTDRLQMTGYLKKQVKKYSLGMKQHLLFAMAVLPKPQLIILDEPLNGLDPSSVLRVREILKELYQEGTTVLFSSHNLDEIDRLTDNIYFLHEGDFISAKDYHAQRLDYTFVLEEIVQAAAYLAQQQLTFEQLAPKKIEVTLTQDEYQEFLEYCQLNEILIHDTAISEESTQNIYFDLFRSKDYETDEV
ncbi:ABC transporter ATP-binding protein [Enterococcus sp. LJL90]